MNIKIIVLFIVILSQIAGSAVAQVKTTINLSTSWKFKTDPTNIGASSGAWYSSTYDDSSWGTLLSGRSWESQGQAYSGWAWYRQTINVPVASQNVPLQALQLNLSSLVSDDDVWFNGVHVGGVLGAYKYLNLQTRSYTVDKSLVHFGAPNTIAVRVWGGPQLLTGYSSGLTSGGTYTAVLDPFRVSARNVNGTLTTEKPLQLYDLSFAQKGTTGFWLVFRYPKTLIPAGHTASLTSTLTDFYGVSIATATTVPVTIDTDNIARGVVNVSAASAQNIYLGGRFKATLVLKDVTNNNATLSSTTASMDHLLFAARDTTQLPALSPVTNDPTPYGTLKLIDTITCSDPLTTEQHPYMQDGINAGQKNNTPGSKVTSSVTSILGKNARTSNWGWFAYRIGRGALTPGKTYVLRIEYAEDKHRYCAIGIEAGHNYSEVGWKNGIGSGVGTPSTDPYDPWPLSGAWQFYDVMVPFGEETTGSGGAGDDVANNGFWVYFMNEVNPGKYWALYEGGPAIASIKLYEISSATNAPVITLPPAGIAQRVLMFDWEKQAEQNPTDIVNYAKLMGYNAVSPIMLKWALSNWGDTTNGYDTANTDAQGYWVQNNATNPAVAPIPGVASTHQQYLAATLGSGIDYFPRFEYGGSASLPTTAQAIDKTGAIAQPTRFGPLWCADLVNPATYTDLKVWMENVIKPYTLANPQLKGVLWRIREMRLPISYAKIDGDTYHTDTGVALPGDWSTETPAIRATWLVNQGATYTDWWHDKRRKFHEQVEALLKTYARPAGATPLTLYYYNWDPDKFSMKLADQNAGNFTFSTAGYNADRTARAALTDTDYTTIMSSGNFAVTNGTVLSTSWYSRPEFGLRPSLYTGASSAGIQLFAPADWLCFTGNTYLNYFKTYDGMAFSHSVSYDELLAGYQSPKYPGTMVTPGGGPYSMALELMAYYQADARTLTYTAYTYGRGFADAHRRFAQAFRALPAVPGTLATGTPTNIAARTYSTTNGTYIGIAYKGLTPSASLNVDLPGTWTTSNVVTDLVTNTTIPTVIVSGKLRIARTFGAMELDAYRVDAGTGTNTAFVTGQTLGTILNNYTGWRGMKITVGASAITVKELGRWVVSGNTGTHTVELVRASDNAVLGSVSVSTSGAPVGFKYATLGSPVTLAANTIYYVASQEVSGGDQWYNADTSLTTTSVAAVNSGIYSSNGTTWTVTWIAGHCSGPVSFKY